MTDQRRLDDAVRSWVRSGPEMASADFVERTLQPIPHMRQRRSWRIAVERAGRPVVSVLGAAAVLVLLVAGLGLLLTRPGVGGPTPSIAPSPSRPTFELRITGGPGEGVYTADPATSLNSCRRADNGSWSLLYAGGTPFVNMDLVVGSGVEGAGGSNRAALELYAGPGYLRFDPAALRGGDPPGRSSATVEVRPEPGGTTLVVDATTPDRTSGNDGAPVEVHLSVTCPA
jgi:hypothetical protein